MVVYPNPTTGELNIEIFRIDENRIDMVLLDATGKIIHHDELQTHQSEMRHRLQLANLPDGVYMIKVHIGDKVLTRRVAKE